MTLISCAVVDWFELQHILPLFIRSGFMRFLLIILSAHCFITLHLLFLDLSEHQNTEQPLCLKKKRTFHVAS